MHMYIHASVPIVLCGQDRWNALQIMDHPRLALDKGLLTIKRMNEAVASVEIINNSVKLTDFTAA